MTRPEGAGARRAAEARRRLKRITALLERRFGVPSRRSRRDLVGSLIGTILSQNTTDANSGAAYASLRERFATWDAVARADVRSIELAIRSGGLERVKARRIRAIVREIAAERGAIDLSFLRGLPTDEVVDYLRHFAGVGSKTAAVVALFGLGREIMPVDTHVHRVVGRIGVVGRPRTREATYRVLAGLVPGGKSLSLHVNLIRLGRALCRPRRPRCPECPIRAECDFGRRSVCEARTVT